MGYKPIQWNRGDSHRRHPDPEPSGKLCSQCKDEPAVGSVQLEGKWHAVGKSCRRAMRLARAGEIPISGGGPSTRHKAPDKVPSKPQSGNGKHRR